MNDRVTITHLEDGIADVRMVRTDKMNALDNAQFQALADTIEELHGTKGLRCVVLSGEGRAFCAGLDLTAMQANSAKGEGGKKGGVTGDLGTRTHGEANLAQYVAWGWRKLEVPVIAAAHGVAFGGGFQILSGADIRFIHPDTRCAIMEMKWGLVPDMAGFPLWRGNARDDVIRELTYTNREFSGTEAHAWALPRISRRRRIPTRWRWRRSSPTSTRPRCAAPNASAMPWLSCLTLTC